jgi:hypothetical protein
MSEWRLFEWKRCEPTVYIAVANKGIAAGTYSYVVLLRQEECVVTSELVRK